jgi:phosphinothricin acetyltransferase
MTAITNHAIATSAIHFGYDPLAPDELAAQWRAHADRYPWLVGQLDAAVIGYAKAGAWRERTAYAWTCETTIYLAESARGRGLGRALYTALLDEVARRGFHSAIGGITLPNPASVALHQRLGFQSVGVVRDAGFKFDRCPSQRMPWVLPSMRARRASATSCAMRPPAALWRSCTAPAVARRGLGAHDSAQSALRAPGHAACDGRPPRCRT